MDREKVIEEFNDAKELVWLDDDEYTIGYNNGIEVGKNITLALLKEQEAKTGHWIWLQYCANEGVYCSECHTKMFDRYPMKKKLSQFCGHCGAKMDDEVEDL